MTQLFRNLGLKVTPQRELIFEILWGADDDPAASHPAAGHPTADAVFAEARQRMPMISLRTVYQTLNDLAYMGELHHLDLGTGSSRYDPNTEVHHHLVCTSCGKVRDVFADYSAIRVPGGAASGFQVGAAEVVFRGLCDDCQTRLNGSPPVPPALVSPTNQPKGEY